VCLEKEIEELQMAECTKRMKFCSPRKLNIAFTRIANPYGHPNILAELIAGYGIQFHFAKQFKKLLNELTEQAGIQVQIARPNRRKRNATCRMDQREKEGLLYKTFELKLIDYCCYPVRTIYGVLGSFMRIFVDEEALTQLVFTF